MRTQSRLIILTSVAALFLAPIASQSALLVVPDQYATIQSAFNAATSGDSIMVRSGTYVESLTFAGKDVILFGESGAEATVITPETARILEMGIDISPLTIVSDLTIRNGLAEDGGGILLKDGASPVLRRLRVLSNLAFRDGGSTWGGAILAGSGSSVVIEDCLFQDNVADYWCCDPPGQGYGGAISASSGSEIRVARTTFVNNFAVGFEGGFGGGIHVASGASAVIVDSSFRGNVGYGGGVGSNGEITVERCVFEGHPGYTGAAILSGGRSFIRGNLFFDNNTWGEGGVIHIDPTAPGDFSHNTVAFNTGGGVFIRGDVVRNNIIASNSEFGLYYLMPAPGSITCNDVWDNTVNYGDFPDQTGVGGNISLDPRFCDPSARDLHLHSDSPCAPLASDCLLIGALDVGCAASSVDSDESIVGTPRFLPPRPNPIRPPAAFTFELPVPAIVQLVVYDAMGRRTGTIAEGSFSAGRHEIVWSARTDSGRDLSSGVYFLRFVAAGHSKTERLVLIR